MPGRVAPSAYARGCAERFREIISTKISKTAFRDFFDPRNISTIRVLYTIRYPYICFLIPDMIFVGYAMILHGKNTLKQ